MISFLSIIINYIIPILVGFFLLPPLLKKFLGETLVKKLRNWLLVGLASVVICLTFWAWFQKQHFESFSIGSYKAKLWETQMSSWIDNPKDYKLTLIDTQSGRRNVYRFTSDDSPGLFFYTCPEFQNIILINRGLHENWTIDTKKELISARINGDSAYLSKFKKIPIYKK